LGKVISPKNTNIILKEIVKQLPHKIFTNFYGAPMTVLTGVKAPFELTQYAIAIKQQGIDFVIRHYSHQSGKSLSLAEARALTDAGLQIGVLWEGPRWMAPPFATSRGSTRRSAPPHRESGSTRSAS
jgi:hypothetical protein